MLGAGGGDKNAARGQAINDCIVSEGPWIYQVAGAMEGFNESDHCVEPSLGIEGSVTEGVRLEAG